MTNTQLIGALICGCARCKRIATLAFDNAAHEGACREAVTKERNAQRAEVFNASAKKWCNVGTLVQVLRVKNGELFQTIGNVPTDDPWRAIRSVQYYMQKEEN
jgi:hypothetical protein